MSLYDGRLEPPPERRQGRCERCEELEEDCGCLGGPWVKS